MPREPFVLPGHMVLSFNSLGDIRVSTSTKDAQFRAEFKQAKYRMTEEQFVSLRRAEDGLEEFLPTEATVNADELVFEFTPEDAKFRVEYEDSPDTRGSLTERQFVELRRAETGLEEFIPAKMTKPATAIKLNPLATDL